MRTAITIEKQINNYLVQLNAKEKAAVLSVVKTFAESRHEEEAWGDKAFIADLDRRMAEYESGKAKVLTIDQLEAGARKYFKAKYRK